MKISYNLLLRFFTVAAVVMCFGIGTLRADTQLDSLLEVLEATMNDRVKFEQEKEDKLKGLKQLIAEKYLSEADNHRLVNRLIREYYNYCFDSTLAYFNAMVDLNAPADTLVKHSEAVMIQAMLYARASSYKQSMDLMDRLDSSILDRERMIQYYTVYKKIYEDLEFYASIQQNKDEYKILYERYSAGLVRLIDERDDLFYQMEEKRFRDSRQMEECHRINSIRLSKMTMDDPGYAGVVFERSLIHEINGDQLNRKKQLILSAIADIRAAVKDNASLATLSTILHEEGDVERAYKYIHFALEDAKFFNSKLRFVEISKILPLITASYQQRIKEKNDSLTTYLSLISVLSVILAVLLINVVRAARRVRQTKNELQVANNSLRDLNSALNETVDSLNETNVKLLETDSIKELYIANFLNICSDFIYKLENYQRMVRKLLTNRKFEELMKMASAQEFIDNEVEEFHATFDKTFLTIYPDFVEKVNGLLEEGEQIELKKGEKLNTELRIFALIRLGINDSSKISKLLRYSVNTIYNYRVKVKNKAKGDRDAFEEQIMKINAFAK